MVNKETDLLKSMIKYMESFKESFTTYDRIIEKKIEELSSEKASMNELAEATHKKTKSNNQLLELTGELCKKIAADNAELKKRVDSLEQQIKILN